MSAWQRVVHEYGQVRLRRRAAADTWFPLVLGAGQARVDVIGGGRRRLGLPAGRLRRTRRSPTGRRCSSST
ncbi:hypothetical protein ABZW02_04535 [Streptomyces sp. NPDC005180]|uniref:hypothetical protein n=1 Tax=Streptomyces sp. NPDC005180 TaxID=3156868 RepID=UPI0033A8FEE6